MNILPLGSESKEPFIELVGVRVLFPLTVGLQAHHDERESTRDKELEP